MDEQNPTWRPIGGADDGGSGSGSSLDRLRDQPAGAVVIGIVVAVALTVGGLLFAATAASPDLDLDPRVGEATGSAPLGAPPLVVDVAGAVRAPGLYRLPAGSRVGDAITAAGGFGPGIDAVAVANSINLAALLSDGQKIVVPGRGSSTGANPTASGGSGPRLVDINHASQAELEALPGIGPATATKIIAARAERPFASPQELLDRKVVGNATFQKIRDLITAG